MAISHYTRVGDYHLEADDSAEITVAIVIRAADAEDIEALLASVKRDAVKMIRRGDEGVYEAQWCNSAARVCIERVK